MMSYLFSIFPNLILPFIRKYHIFPFSVSPVTCHAIEIKMCDVILFSSYLLPPCHKLSHFHELPSSPQCVSSFVDGLCMNVNQTCICSMSHQVTPLLCNFRDTLYHLNVKHFIIMFNIRENVIFQIIRMQYILNLNSELSY